MMLLRNLSSLYYMVCKRNVPPSAYGVAASVIISHKSTPKAHTSFVAIRMLLLILSGDIHRSVGFAEYRVRSIPILMMTQTLLSVTKTFNLQRGMKSRPVYSLSTRIHLSNAERSRCTIFLLCRKTMPLTTSIAKHF